MNLNPQIITGNNIHQKNNNENVVGSKYLFSQNNENSANWLNVPNKEIKTFKEEELWQKFMKFFLKTSHESTEMELSEVFPQKRAMCNESSSVMECENKSEDMPRVSPIFQCHYNTHK